MHHDHMNFRSAAREDSSWERVSGICYGLLALTAFVIVLVAESAVHRRGREEQRPTQYILPATRHHGPLYPFSPPEFCGIARPKLATIS
jgi:hypothetical protein